MKAGAARGWALVAAMAVLGLTLALAAALLTYHSGDPSLSTAAGGPAENLLGTPGAFIADLAFSILGLPVAGLLAVGAVCGWRMWSDEPAGRWRRMLAVAAIGAMLVSTGLAICADATSLRWPAGPGGLVGITLAGAVKWLIALIGLTERQATGLNNLIAAILGVAGAVVWFASLGLRLPSLPRFQRRKRPARLTDARETAPASEPTIRQP
ncbi:MAG: DNA translocase FtsK 4TM domain-containing protein, partial [Proteobacteria bacterium]|nr:DNA translocase FtsK 4TM domain-containing protein [Pseudomonadota bacterium]